MPFREEAAPEELPDGIDGYGERDGVAGADDESGEDIAGIMDAIVDAGEADAQGEGAHNPETAAIKEKQDHRHGGPVGGVGGGHTAGIRTAQALDDIGEQSDAGAGSFDGFFDDIQHKRVADGNDEDDEQGTNPRPWGAKTKDADDGEQGQGNKKTVAAHDGHQPVKEGVAQGAVDKMEQRDVE